MLVSVGCYRLWRRKFVLSLVRFSPEAAKWAVTSGQASTYTTLDLPISGCLLPVSDEL